MLKKANKTLGIISIFLSMIVLTPSVMLPSLLQTRVEPTMLSVNTMSSVKTITALNQTFPTNEFIRTEEWSNGTKFHFSEHIILNDPTCRDVYVNCTTWRTPELLQRIKTAQSQKQEPEVIKTMSTKYQYHQFIDGLYFLLEGNNGTHLVSYDHDDNYDTYYPQEWYARYNLTGDLKTHVHLAKDMIDDWRNGVLDTASLMGTVFAIIGGGLTTVGGVATVLECPWVGVPAIIGGIASIIAAIVIYVYYTQLASWIRDVVTEQFSGDGWSWIGAIIKSILRVSYPSPTCIHGNQLMVHPWGLWDIYQVRNWQQSWGAEGVFPSPTQDYSVSWWTGFDIRYTTNAVCLP